MIVSRRANFYQVLEIFCGVWLLAMLMISWLALGQRMAPGGLIPSSLTASLLVGTLVPAMGLLVLLGRRTALRRADNIMGSTGRLHVRLVFLFSLIAAIPTLLVVMFASFLFQSGVEFWFSDNSRGMVENANKLAQGYYQQNLRDVGNEAVTMASDLRDYLEQTRISSPAFAEAYSYQIVYRKLNGSAILQKGPDGALRTAAIIDPGESGHTQRVPPATIKKLDSGEPVVVSATADRIEAVTPIDLRSGSYLYVARSSDALALSQWERAQKVLKSYNMLTQRAQTLQLRFNLALFFVSLALVGLAVWFALRFADRQVKPLAELVSAARRVGAGNFALRVEGRTGNDEIGLLNRAFNRMTSQIEQQTRALVGANRQLDERRAFIEAVLESLTAGVVSIDASGEIRLMNSSAQKLLLEQPGMPPEGTRLEQIAPQIAALVDAELSGGIVQYNKGSELLTLAVKIARDAAGRVIAFEDITRQLLDQRQAAWSDVARRIAHEIKNPLTPIQLATERLNRRYRRQIETDPELFEELTSTIIRQVGELRRMVDEFSSFARLPKPIFRGEDAVDLVRQALFLQEVARPEIDFAFESSEPVVAIACDRHQFGQAMTNILKNAVEAIEARAKNAEPDYRGKISVKLDASPEELTIALTDNGIGLTLDTERLIEPYVTTREKGTGLGLAIVNKIVEEHDGELNFAAAPSGGTTVILKLARDPLPAGNSMGAEAAE